MRGPGWGGDEVAVNDGFGHGEIYVGATGLGDVGADGGIGAALFASNNLCSGEDLSGVTDGSDGFVRLGEVANDFDDARVEANVFGSVDGAAHMVAGFFAGTDGVDGVADHLKSLERDHDFVVFDVIAEQHENGFLGHESLRKTKMISETRMPAWTGAIQ